MKHLFCMLAAVALFAIVGCGSKNKAPEAAKDHKRDKSEEKSAFAKLSPEDAQAAKQQATCPVSGEPLGSMGTPKKVDVKEQSVWICCESCRESLVKDPDKYLAKLNK